MPSQAPQIHLQYSHCTPADGHVQLLTPTHVAMVVHHPQMFPPGPSVPSGATVPPGGTGQVTVTQAGGNGATVSLAGLTSQTGYLACVVAADVWDNKVARVQEVTFVTLDITPPVVTLAVLPGTDGLVSCDRWVGVQGIYLCITCRHSCLGIMQDGFSIHVPLIL